MSHCCDLTLSGGSRQIDDHVDLPLRLQVELRKDKDGGKNKSKSQGEKRSRTASAADGAVLQHKQTQQPTHKRSLSSPELHFSPALVSLSPLAPLSF